MDKELQTILDAMFLSTDNLSYERVRQFQEENPQYARQIATAFAEWKEIEFLGVGDSKGEELPLSSSIESLLKKALEETRKNVETNIADLTKVAADKGISRDELLTVLGVSETIMRKIDRRQVDVPISIQSKIADLLAVSLDALKSFFALPPTLSPNANYKSNSTPRTQQKQSFEAAVKGDPELSDAEKLDLLRSI